MVNNWNKLIIHNFLVYHRYSKNQGLLVTIRIKYSYEALTSMGQVGLFLHNMVVCNAYAVIQHLLFKVICGNNLKWTPKVKQADKTTCSFRWEWIFFFLFLFFLSIVWEVQVLDNKQHMVLFHSYTCCLLQLGGLKLSPSQNRDKSNWIVH